MQARSTAAADRVVQAVKTDPRAGKYLTFELGPEEFASKSSKCARSWASRTLRRRPRRRPT